MEQAYIDYPISFLADRSQEIQPQGLLTDPASGSSGLYQSGGTWNQSQFQTTPIQQVYIYIYIYICFSIPSFLKKSHPRVTVRSN